RRRRRCGRRRGRRSGRRRRWWRRWRHRHSLGLRGCRGRGGRRWWRRRGRRRGGRYFVLHRRRRRGGGGAGVGKFVGVVTRDEQRHRNHERNRGHDGRDADHPWPARSTVLVIGVGGIVVGVVVVEPGVGRHIRAADEMLGLGSRVGPRIRIRLARLVWRRYFAAVVEWFQPVMGIEFAGFHFIAGIRFMAELAGGIGFIRIPSRRIWPAHLCLPCPTSSPARGAPRLLRCARAREILIVPGQTLPNGIEQIS